MPGCDARGCGIHESLCLGRLGVNRIVRQQVILDMPLHSNGPWTRNVMGLSVLAGQRGCFVKAANATDQQGVMPARRNNKN
jgi:hypothetical protein